MWHIPKRLVVNGAPSTGTTCVDRDEDTGKRGKMEIGHNWDMQECCASKFIQSWFTTNVAYILGRFYDQYMKAISNWQTAYITMSLTLQKTPFVGLEYLSAPRKYPAKSLAWRSRSCQLHEGCPWMWLEKVQQVTHSAWVWIFTISCQDCNDRSTTCLAMFVIGVKGAESKENNF